MHSDQNVCTKTKHTLVDKCYRKGRFYWSLQCSATTPGTQERGFLACSLQLAVVAAAAWSSSWHAIGCFSKPADAACIYSRRHFWDKYLGLGLLIWLDLPLIHTHLLLFTPIIFRFSSRCLLIWLDLPLIHAQLLLFRPLFIVVHNMLFVCKSGWPAEVDCCWGWQEAKHILAAFWGCAAA
jgi:hypothetical protein